MTPGKVVVAVGCVYELAALPDRSPLPTITYLTGQSWHWRRPLGPLALGVATVVSVVHFWRAVRAAGVALVAAHDLDLV